MSEPVSRREALKRLGATGAAVAAVSGTALWLHGRRPRGAAPEPYALPSWAVAKPASAPDLVVARGSPAASLVTAALEEMGGIQRFVQPGDVVLIKPNAAFDRPAWQGSTTNPDVLRAMVAACMDAGAREVLVTDNPIHVPEGCFRKTGLGKAAEDGGGSVWLPRKADFGPVALPDTVLDGWEVFLEPLKRATKVIGIAPVKDHNLSRASMTLKNWYGLLGGPRNRLHQKLDETIATLAGMVKPTLSVLDGTRILIRNGPTGGSPDDVIDGNVLAMGTDGVALDAFGATLLELGVADLTYLQMAEQWGHGASDWMALDTREVTV
ncbi:MAG: DUF362 domain-containing protein [Planctomycetota bacterium]|nr:DUF362 domain-containing protein [Planctomycetota bacterium]